MSGKGGVGKTFVSANLGLALGRKDKQVLLIDADLPSGNLAHYLGLNNPHPSLTEFLAGEEDSIEEILKESNAGVDVLPATGSLRSFLSADIGKIKNFLQDLKEDYDYILIDSPPGISKNSISPIEASDQILLVINPDRASVSSAEKVQKIGNLLERGVRGFILNKGKERGFFENLFGEETQMSTEKVEARMATENLGKIPYDDKVRESTELGEPLLEYDESSKASKAIKKISENI